MTMPTISLKIKIPVSFASVLYPNCPWQNNVLEIRRGIIGSDGVKVEATAFADKFPEDPSLTTSGKDGLVMQGDCSRTGFTLRNSWIRTTGWNKIARKRTFMVFRYAETLLNYAEAAVELGKGSQALPRLNEVRNAPVSKRSQVSRSKTCVTNARSNWLSRI